MANPFAGIAERLAGDGYELPSVFAGEKCELQDAVSFVVADFAVGFGVAERGVAAAASANHELANAMIGVGVAFGILRGETFVRMFVSGEDNFGVGVVEILPEGVKFGVFGVFRKQAAAEESVVAVGERANVGVRGKILRQPSFFGRSFRAAAQLT